MFTMKQEVGEAMDSQMLPKTDALISDDTAYNFIWVTGLAVTNWIHDIT